MSALKDSLGQMAEDDQDRILRKGLQSILNEELRTSMSRKLKKEHGIGPTLERGTKVVKMPMMRKLMPIAAAILLLMSVFIWMIPSRSAQDMAMLWIQQQEIFHPGLTKGSQEVELSRTEAIQAFDAGQYLEAARLFSGINVATTEDRFYLGLSHFLAEDYNAAVEVFEAMDAANTTFGQEITWYLALSYVFTDRKEDAKAALSSIQQDEWNYAEAQKLLRTLQ